MVTYNLCKSGCCPVVKVTGDSIKIGEEGNLCTLKRSEWETLKSKIKSGEIC